MMVLATVGRPDSRDSLFDSLEYDHILSWSVIFFSILGKPVAFDSRPLLTRWRKSTMASFSATPWLLKCFRTVLVNWCFVWRRASFFLAIVGEKSPTLPGCVRTQER